MYFSTNFVCCGALRALECHLDCYSLVQRFLLDTIGWAILVADKVGTYSLLINECFGWVSVNLNKSYKAVGPCFFCCFSRSWYYKLIFDSIKFWWVFLLRLFHGSWARADIALSFGTVLALVSSFSAFKELVALYTFFSFLFWELVRLWSIIILRFILFLLEGSSGLLTSFLLIGSVSWLHQQNGSCLELWAHQRHTSTLHLETPVTHGACINDRISLLKYGLFNIWSVIR